MSSLEPKLLTVLREGYSRSLFMRDAGAGLVVGVVALPLAIAFGIASGVGPEQGIYTAIIAGFIISALSGSRFQIGGPTGAFVILIYSTVQEVGYDGLVVATVAAGLLLVVMGWARMGTLIRYIPYPVTVGFTAGIAIVIAKSQWVTATGISGPDWLPDPYSLLITFLTVATLLVLPKVLRRVPASMVAIVVTTGLVMLFDLPVATIGSEYGSMPSSLPSFRLPHVEMDVLPHLVSPALSIALLAGIESLLSAVVADGMTGRRHRSNAELVAQGVANIVTPFFGGIPATGAIARTATNIKNGAATPVSGMIHAATLLVILLVAGPWATLIPMATLAGILFVVAFNMAEGHLFLRILKSTRGDAVVLLSTFALTVFVDLAVAIQVGVVLAAFLFTKRMAEVAHVKTLDADEDESDLDPQERMLVAALPDTVEVFEVNGPFFFGAAHKFASALSGMQRRPRVLILRMRNVLALDATGLRVLEQFLETSEHNGPALVISGIHAQPLVLLERSGFMDRIGRDNVVGSFSDACSRAKTLVP